MTVFLLLCLVSAGIYLLNMFMPDAIPVLDVSESTRFTLSSVFILLTLATIPLSLRLFKFRKIERDLYDRQAPALLKWGLIRMLMIGNLLLFNIAFYYLLAEEPTHGWLAVILVLVLPFIVPTMGRCMAEVTPEDISESVPDEPAVESEPDAAKE